MVPGSSAALTGAGWWSPFPLCHQTIGTTTMPDLMLGRRQFADEIAAIANLKTRALVEAFAAVPREQFLPPGPWFIRSDADRVGRLTADADPAHVYHNGSIAIAGAPRRTQQAARRSAATSCIRVLAIV